LTGRFTTSCYNGTTALRGEERANALRSKFRNFAVVGEEDVTSSAGSKLVGQPLLERTTLRLPGSVQHDAFKNFKKKLVLRQPSSRLQSKTVCHRNIVLTGPRQCLMPTPSGTDVGT